MSLLQYLTRISVLTLFFLSGTAFAQSSDFTIQALIGDDTVPPTVPTGFSATPVAMTQIDLVWNASTDDYLLSGYHVFRDNVQVATTTGTTYSDVGLTASTTYTYYVTAFDSFYNISASSSLVSTTTFATPTPPVVEEGDEGGTVFGSRNRLGDLTSLTVLPSQRGAIIRYTTDTFVRSVVRWGTTISYERGSSVERSFSHVHETVIGDLTPGTRYRFVIEGENERGRAGVLTESSFVTLPEDDTLPPSIVSELVLSTDGTDIVLTWENPDDIDFDHVRVMRSENFFPGSDTEGWLVYEGNGERARDLQIATLGKGVYYTVFAYDTLGNVSAGAVASIRIHATGTDVHAPNVEEETNPLELTLDMISMYQDNERITHDQGSFRIDGGKHLTIAIPYTVLPEHLKAILVTVIPQHDTEKELRFLLRVNPEKTAYTARLAPIGIQEVFLLRVSVFDFKTTQVGYTQGRIVSHIRNYVVPTETEGEKATLLTRTLTTFLSNYVILFVLFLLLLAYLARRLLSRE